MSYLYENVLDYKSELGSNLCKPLSYIYSHDPIRVYYYIDFFSLHEKRYNVLKMSNKIIWTYSYALIKIIFGVKNMIKLRQVK